MFPVAISVDEGEALRAWATRERAQQTVEVGLGYGVSSLYVCDALVRGGSPRARHVAIDPYQCSRFADCGLQLLAEAGVAHLVDHFAERSEVVLPRLLSDGARFDFAFVDGNHRFDGVFVDLFYLGRLVSPGGVIFLDDYDLPGIQRAVAFYVTNLGWSVEEVSAPDKLHQWAVVRTTERPDERPYDYFEPF